MDLLYVSQSDNQSNAKIELIKMFGLTLGDVINLNRLAIQASDMSQSPTSEIKVGASVLTTNGNMYQGTNIESSSCYGSSITAEDCAIFKAMSEGQNEIKAIAVHVKHLVKDEYHLQSSALHSTTSNNSAGGASALGTNSTLISPRLVQSLQHELFNLPDVNRSFSQQSLGNREL